MRSNWQIRKLSEVCSIINGSTPLRSNKEFWDNGDVPWFTIDDIREQGRVIKSTKQKITKKALGKISARLLPPESVLLCCTASIGEYALSKISLTTNQQFNGLVIKDKKLLDSKFLFYFSSTLKGQLLALSGKTTIDFIPISRLKDVPIPVPSLSEQQRIVKILDEVFEKIAKAKENTEKNLQNSKDLFESYLQNIFMNPGKDWEEKRLEELGQITSSKRIFKKEYVKVGIPFYRIKEIKELANGKDISTELFISRNRYLEIKNAFGVPKEGDILITAVGTIGEIYVVKKDEDFYYKDGNILWLKNFISIDPYFLKYVLISFVEQINKLSKGSAYNALTIEKIEKHCIYIPKSLSKQKNIVAKLDALSAQTKKLKENYKEKLDNLEELKKSVLKSAFAGEL